MEIESPDKHGLPGLIGLLSTALVALGGAVKGIQALVRLFKHSPPIRVIPEPETPALPAAPSILVVDDHQGIVDVLRDLLEEAGFGVSGYTSSIEALEEFRNRLKQGGEDRFDIALIDLNMPGRNGFQLTHALLLADPGLVVGIITGSKLEAISDLGRVSGVQFYVSKPFDNEELVLRMSSVLNFARLKRENLDLKKRLKK